MKTHNLWNYLFQLLQQISPYQFHTKKWKFRCAFVFPTTGIFTLIKQIWCSAIFSFLLFEQTFSLIGNARIRFFFFCKKYFRFVAFHEFYQLLTLQYFYSVANVPLRLDTYFVNKVLYVKSIFFVEILRKIISIGKNNTSYFRFVSSKRLGPWLKLY